jgi:imidazolonepropionase-like amidohydrolase
VRSADGAGFGGLPAAYATEEQFKALAASGIPVGPTLGGFTAKLMAATWSAAFRQRLADAGITPENLVEMRMSILRQITTFGIGFISGADAGIGPPKAHGRYAEAVIELGRVTGTVPALVAASSGAAAAIGLGTSKGRLRSGYDADVLVVGGDLVALQDVRQVVLRGLPAPQ